MTRMLLLNSRGYVIKTNYIRSSWETVVLVAMGNKYLGSKSAALFRANKKFPSFDILCIDFPKSKMAARTFPQCLHLGYFLIANPNHILIYISL